MPVYNAGDFLVEAIQSLQNQTYENWELIAVDDYSLDNSWKILQEFSRTDKRIKIYRNGGHHGVAHAANLALKKARGQFVARMDADDISLPWRLENQIEFLKNHPQVTAVGGQCDLIDKEGTIIGKKEFPTNDQEMRKTIFYRIPLQQPTMMVNKKLLPKKFTWYEETCDVAEEVELLFKLFQNGQVSNLPQTVLQYRLHGKNTSLQNPKKTFYLTLKTRLAAIFKYNYRPTFWGIMVTIAQLLLVTFLPNKLIYPAYIFIRGIKRLDFSLIGRPLLNAFRYEEVIYGQ